MVSFTVGRDSVEPSYALGSTESRPTIKESQATRLPLQIVCARSNTPECL
jgi:hypothetical protein